jgi:drug/metabolite transporter (DMT)-like permease
VVAGVACLFYLVPPVAALIAFLLFGEQLSAVQIIGMAVAALGVAIANRSQRAHTSLAANDPAMSRVFGSIKDRS